MGKMLDKRLVERLDEMLRVGERLSEKSGRWLGRGWLNFRLDMRINGWFGEIV